MSGIGQVLLAAGGSYSYRVTIAGMSSDSGITSFYGYGSQAWRTAAVWNPSGGGPSGAITSTPYRNGTTTGVIESVHSSSDFAGALFVVMSGGTPATSTFIRSIVFQTVSGVYQTGTYHSVDTFIPGYTRYRFTVGNNWSSGQLTEVKALVLFN